MLFNKNRGDRGYSLKSKISLSYIMVIVICILLVVGLTNLLFDIHFKEYVKQNQERTNNLVVNQLALQYMNNGSWDAGQIEFIGMNALSNGLIIRVYDNSGTVLWDATHHNNGMCQRIIAQMADNLASRYPRIEGYYMEIPYAISYPGGLAGRVEIGAYGPFHINEHDVAFMNTLNQVMIGVVAFSLLLALVIAHVVAKRINAPVLEVIQSARLIEKGYFSDRISLQTDTAEMNQLIETINNLAETMEKQELLRKRLTGDLAHELRTPLATLKSHMEAMVDGIWEPDKERLASCHDEIERISRMVGDLEKLAKFEGENLILNKEQFDVTELAKRLVKNFEKDFLNKNIQVQIKGDSETVYADKDKISQVIVNLLSNAQKYTPEGGNVMILVRREEKYTKIIVADDGIGISLEDQPYIFERFYRVDKSRNRMTGGAGIGLAIAKSIVTAHKGNIEVKSRMGEGTEFVIQIPNE